MPFLAVLYDSEVKSWLRFTDPVEEVAVHSLDRVLPTLDYIEARVEQEGLYAAGFVSYEAAPAFDEALQTHPAEKIPLLQFGLFADPEKISLPRPLTTPQNISWERQESLEEFADKVKKIQMSIARGETYQVNLTFPLIGQVHQDPWQFFLQLVTGQQSTSCGFLQSERWAICSASPELFFARDGDQLSMKPMKGTAPRGRTLAEDKQQSEMLRLSAKNRAENIMILDMVRNDLGRLAPPGQVRTDAICTLEKYPTVWQMTSSVTALGNASLRETFQALFPCASITGAPKAKTMQIIKEIEARPRQVYTGSFGWVAPGRKAHFNVAIRTVIIDREINQATYGVGAGITWDSDAAEEYRECLDKAVVLTSPVEDFALLETLRWTPGKGFFVLAEHLARMQASAEYFDFSFDPRKTVNYLDSLAQDFSPSPQRVRLLLYRDGKLTATILPFSTDLKNHVKVRFSDIPVQRENIFLFHKTTRRDLYEQNLANAGEADEVILWNKQGYVTECCTANIVIEKAGRLLTPRLECGLLPGTYREYLLKKGILHEAIIEKNDLLECTRIFLINALHKWRRAELIK